MTLRYMPGPGGGEGYGLTSADRMRAMYARDGTTFETIQRTVIWLLRVLSLPLEIFLHTRFGVRYLTILFFLASLLVMMVFWASLGLIDTLLGELGGRSMFHEKASHELVRWCIGIYSAVGIWQLSMSGGQVFTGIKVHTRYSGSPWQVWFWLPFLNEEYMIKRLWEPLFCLGVAWGVWSFLYEDIVAWYIGICAVAMALKSHLEYTMLRARVYDMIDAQIDAEELQQAVLHGRQPHETRGSMVGGIVRQSTSMKDRARIVRNLGGELDPELDKLLTDEDGSGASLGLEFGPDPAKGRD